MRKLRKKVVLKYCLVLIVGFIIGYISNANDYIFDEQALIDSILRDGQAEAIGKNVLAHQKQMEEGSYTGFFLTKYDIILCNTESTCIHETGHWIDKYLGNISESVEFRQAIDTFILNCEYKLTEYCWLALFPGLNNNELNIDDWGGYNEAYATIYEYDMFLGYPMPQVFIEFYNN